jgi:transposase
MAPMTEMSPLRRRMFKRIATRYDKTDESFAAMIQLVSTFLALR